MPAPEDEFELILERCRTRLSEIDLRLPELEAAAPPRTPAASLLEPEPPPRPAPPPAPILESFPDPAPAEDAAPVGTPVPVEAAAPPTAPNAEAEPEIFPPRPVTPAPLAAPSPAAPPRRRRLWAETAAIGAALAAAGYFWTSARAPRALTLPLDGADAMAVRPDLHELLVARGDRLLTLSFAGKVLSRETLSTPVTSLRWSRGSLWSADGRSPQVVERRAGTNPTVYRLNHVPTALFASDDYLWTVAAGSRQIHQYLISRSILGVMLQPLDAFELPDLAPESLAVSASGELWVVDADSRRLDRLRAQNGVYRIVASAPLSPFAGPGGSISGLTIDDGAVWLCVHPAAGMTRVLRVPLGELRWSRS
jgi:hypothetical protein